MYDNHGFKTQRAGFDYNVCDKYNFTTPRAGLPSNMYNNKCDWTTPRASLQSKHVLSARAKNQPNTRTCQRTELTVQQHGLHLSKSTFQRKSTCTSTTQRRFSDNRLPSQSGRGQSETNPSAPPPPPPHTKVTVP